MDSDPWISRLAVAKRHIANLLHQNPQSGFVDRMGFDEFDAEEEEVRPDFPCPYCCEDHDIASLCAHLEEEHPFESKVAACPICSVKITRDMLNHITLQHGHLFKIQRRRRLPRFSIPSSQAISLLGRDLNEAHMQLLLGGGGYKSSSSMSTNAASDSFISSLLNFPTLEAEETLKSPIPTGENACIEEETPLKIWKSSFDSSLTNEEREQNRKQVTVRAAFAQCLLLSAIFGE
ncbi:protein DEHYDRATION-INDUCED 19-like [Ananas comosus]|uniref:Protein DEHYDRATION-INDUCED 19-like n=1 Tax=Ananas comosus TaxID=4615 RepID=A0A6P5GBH7_ANACO|nr:protein DEHYDRATION-INDUCED 19-like [Ananas comosus]